MLGKFSNRVVHRAGTRGVGRTNLTLVTAQRWARSVAIGRLVSCRTVANHHKVVSRWKVTCRLLHSFLETSAQVRVDLVKEASSRFDHACDGSRSSIGRPPNT